MKSQLRQNVVLKKLVITLAVPLVGAVCFPIYWYFVVPQAWLSHHKLTWLLGYTAVIITAWILALLIVFIGMCWKNSNCTGMDKSQSTEDLWSEDRYIPEFTYTQPPPAYQTWPSSVQPSATPSPPDEAWDFDYENKLELEQGAGGVGKRSSFTDDQNYLYRTFGYSGPGLGDVSSPEEEQSARKQKKPSVRAARTRGSLPFAGEGGGGEKGEVKENGGITGKAPKRRFSEPQSFLQFSKDDVFDLSTDEENMTPPEPVCDDCMLDRSCAEYKCLHQSSEEHTTSCVNCALSSSSCRAETLHQRLVDTLQTPVDNLENETNVDSEDDNNMHEKLEDSGGASEEEQFKNYMENVDVTSEVWMTTSETGQPTENHQKPSKELEKINETSYSIFPIPEPSSDHSPVPSDKDPLYSDRSPVYSDRSPVSDKKFDLLLASLQSLVIEIEKDFLESPRLGRRMSASADGITSARKDILDSPRMVHLGRRLSASTDDISRTRRSSMVKSWSNGELRKNKLLISQSSLE